MSSALKLEQWKMVELVTRNYWWPGVTKEVKQYVEKNIQEIQELYKDEERREKIRMRK